MQDFQKKIEEMVQQIKNNKRLSLLNYQYRSPLPVEKLKEKQDEYSLAFDPAVFEFYCICGGLDLKWELIDKEGLRITSAYRIKGSINILDIDTMIMGFNGRHWYNELWSDYQTEEIRNFKKCLKIFDYFGSDNVDAVCLEQKDKQLISSLWVNNLDFGSFKLSIDLNTYLQLLIHTKGIWGWQYFYIDRKMQNEPPTPWKGKTESILEIFPQLFHQETVINEFYSNFQSNYK